MPASFGDMVRYLGLCYLVVDVDQHGKLTLESVQGRTLGHKHARMSRRGVTPPECNVVTAARFPLDRGQAGCRW